MANNKLRIKGTGMVSPTTTTTTTSNEQSYYVYDFSSFSGVNNDFSGQFGKYGITNWDGTYRIVAANLDLGTYVYYIGTDGDKYLMTFENSVSYGSNFIAITSGGVEGQITNVQGQITFDSVTPFVDGQTTTTTTTEAPTTTTTTTTSTESPITASLNTNNVYTSGTEDVISVDIDYSSSLFSQLLGDDHSYHVLAIPVDFQLAEYTFMRDGQSYYMLSWAYTDPSRFFYSEVGGPAIEFVETNPDTMWFLKSDFTNNTIEVEGNVINLTSSTPVSLSIIQYSEDWASYQPIEFVQFTTVGDITSMTTTTTTTAGPTGPIANFTWVVNGNTANFNSPTDIDFIDIVPTITSGSGSGAMFDVSFYSGVEYITHSLNGTGYAVGDTVTILGSQLNGTDGVDDIVITITTISGGSGGGTKK